VDGRRSRAEALPSQLPEVLLGVARLPSLLVRSLLFVLRNTLLFDGPARLLGLGRGS
jgi:hypothetical protein